MRGLCELQCGTTKIPSFESRKLCPRITSETPRESERERKNFALNP